GQLHTFCFSVPTQPWAKLVMPLVVRRSSLTYDLRRTTNDRFLYQDDFETPGISPRNASPRKHRRQSPNLRRYARGRPQILQRLCLRVENLGFGPLLPRACSNFFSIFASLTLFAVVMQSLIRVV